MKKEQVAIKLTKKNGKKILNILKYFREPVANYTEGLLDSERHYDQFSTHIEFWNGEWIGSVNDEDKTLIKPKQLRELLKELHKPDVESTITKEVWVVDCGFRVEATTEEATANVISELYRGKKVKGTLTYKI